MSIREWRRKLPLLALLALAGAAGPVDAVRAADDDAVEITAAADVLLFGYREFSEQGRELNREDGILPGVRLSARSSRDRVFVRLDASLHDGTVDYDGETQTGAPVETDTGTRLFSFSAEAGRWVGARPGRWGAYLRVARRLWERDIQSTGSVQGLYEEYRWSEVGAGLRHVWPASEQGRWTHELSAMAFAVVDGDIFVELSGVEGRNWDDTSLELGDESGYRLRYTASRELASGRLLRIEPYYAYWEFGRSNTRTITANGSATSLTVTEPRSESRRIGVSVGLVF
jgi:hypothetical protein